MSSLGKKYDRHRRDILRNVGFLIEGPRLYPQLSGLDNLRVFAHYRNVAAQQLPAVLDEVGLLKHAHKLVRHYSSGMKQRLAIALAMMHTPALLILDEPTNGLDPQGIAEIRQLIIQLKNKPERTLVFCSHILTEVQQLCDEVGILYEGRFVFQGQVKSLGQNALLYSIETDYPALAAKILSARKKWEVSTQNDETIITLRSSEEANEVIDLLRQASVRIFQVKRLEDNLEHTYLKYVK